MLALRLPKDIEDRLDALAKKTGRTKSFYAREAILEHLDDLEDQFYAEQRLAQPDGYVSFNEVLESAGLANEPVDPSVLDGVDLK